MLLYFSWKIILCPSQQHNARLYVNEGGKVGWFLNFSHYPASVMISAGEHLLKTRKTEAAAASPYANWATAAAPVRIAGGDLIWFAILLNEDWEVKTRFQSCLIFSNETIICLFQLNHHMTDRHLKGWKIYNFSQPWEKWNWCCRVKVMERPQFEFCFGRFMSVEGRNLHNHPRLLRTRRAFQKALKC